MTTSSGTITFHYDQNDNVVYETDENNRIVASYTYGPNNEPVSMTRDGKTYYYQTNYRGDVLALTDSSGNVVATYEYDAFGRLLKETGTVENPYRYAGYRYDKETGLYYLQNRYYNPETGRFLSRDLAEEDEFEPITFNKYTYANNNPVMMVDSDGNRARYIKTIKRYWTWYISQSDLDAAATAYGFIDKAISSKKKKYAKKLIISILAKVNKYLYVGIASLWFYSLATGRKGVTIVYVSVDKRWYVYRWSTRKKRYSWINTLSINYAYAFIKPGRKYYPRRTVSYYRY
ncbi:RHS repeat-associated protein [Planifilum fimeticola]|uniref:RHS repeat-associated protein n=2 Tax=Planifilum fimeticola TaxID=201975 RepID=A0A2T0LA99_9BACL|nr:RHS repeat-associated protein [Planifilum fimeticola]